MKGDFAIGEDGEACAVRTYEDGIRRMSEALPASGESTKSLCWNCSRETEPGPFCEHCSKIQPAGPKTDFFSILGLSRRLTIDGEDLERRFYELSRKYHPDFFQGAGPYEQQLSLELSATLNRAYRTLREPFTRAEYLVKLAQGSDQEIAAAPPQELLEEVFEFNERLQDFRMEQDEEEQRKLAGPLENDKSRFEEKETALRDGLNDLFSRWDAGEGTGAIVEELRSLLAQRKYVQNAVNDIAEAMSCLTSA